MVLGLGSRSKKDRPSAVTQLVELDIHLHEIKPWQGLAKPLKTPTVVCLRSTRGERLMGSSRSMSPTLGSGAEIGKIVIGETLRVPIAPNREVLKRAKKSYPDLENPLVFTLLDVNDVKGKPLAQAALELSALASLSESKLIAVPFSVAKKVAKGPMPYLHLTIQRHQEDKASGFPAPASSAASMSSRTSDASSVPPLDEDTQQMLVAALLSDDDDDGHNKEEEIEFFTDDEEEHKNDNHVSKIPQGVSLPQQNAISKVSQGLSLHQENAINKVPSGRSLPQGNTIVESVASTVGSMHDRPSNLAMQQKTEKQQPQRIDERVFKPPPRVDEGLSRHAISSPQASPVKAAAIAAANAYAKKHSFHTRDTSSFIDDSDDLYSDLDSDGEHEFPSRLSQVVQSPRLLRKGLQTAGRSLLTSSSTKSSESAASVSSALESKDEKSVDVNVSEKANVQNNLTAEHKSSTNSGVLTAAEMKTDEGMAAGGRAQLQVSVPIITTENRSTLSRNKDSSGSSFEPKMVPETTSRREFGSGRTSGNNIEIAKSNPTMDSTGEAAIKHQAKTSVETKTKPAGKSPLREKSSSGPPKITISKSPDQMKGRTLQSPVQDGKISKGSSQELKAKAFKSPDTDMEKGDKKLSEEARQRMSNADGKAATTEMRIQHLESKVEKLKGELKDVAAVEAALYSTTAEHGSSSMKLHAPARRLARVYVYACKNWSQERRASCARNSMSGLILVARACGNDVPRLTFWWSNATVLREIISTASNALAASSSIVTMTHSSSQSEKRSSPNGKKLYQQHQTASPSRVCEDWIDPSTFISALERLESWIFTKVVESIWWQVLTPQMQQPVKEVLSEADENDGDLRRDDAKHENRIVKAELEDSRQGNISVEIWKTAFLDAFERLCPVRRLGVECGCLPMLNKLVLEACILRLDVAMFNAILRDDEVPTDPVSDPISDVRVLPIPNSSLSFGLAAQLKNTVATLCSFLSNLASKDAENVVAVGDLDDDERNTIRFPLLKAMGGLLMLPKEMLIDKSLRKEVCPTLDLPFIGRILSKFQPDEFSPEPVTPELLQTINAEVAAENQKLEMNDGSTTFRIAIAPSVIYSPPPSSSVKHWIGDVASTNNHYAKSNSSVLRKGHTSDDEIDELASPMSWLLENTKGFGGSYSNTNAKRRATSSPKDVGTNCRFMLLREVWNSG